MCTKESQHWAATLPLVALASMVVAAFGPAVLVAVFRWRAAWVWVGLPLAIAAYFAGPFLANWARSAGIL
ncbi:hypothetical protein AWC15_08245 [Mycobacterium lacus]|nr:hypothetical protein AWC15_08245 [Mycobacterium lacus]